MNKKCAKCVIIGESKTGKTAIINRFVKATFSDAYRATIGADFALKDVTSAAGEALQLQLWDTAGQDRFAALSTAFYRGAESFVLVCSHDLPESVGKMKEFAQGILDAVQKQKARVIVVVNKNDLPVAQQLVSVDDVQSAMDTDLEPLGITFISSEPISLSAKDDRDGCATDAAFSLLTEDFFARQNGEKAAGGADDDDDDGDRVCKIKEKKKKASTKAHKTKRNFFGFKS